MNDTPIKSGVDVIKEHVRHLSSKAGVYRMLNKHGDVIYVGKAKNLKRRVSNYTQLDRNSNRIQRMIHETCFMAFIETETEAEALILEANLIKKYKPTYNVLLRDDKMFPYIKITKDHDFPLLTKHRGKQDKKSDYYGPFASVSAVHKTINALQKAFKLRNCSDSIFEQRKRPCLQYQIKRCTAPCVDYVTKSAYDEQVRQAKAFLSGKSREIQKDLEKKMIEASEALDFETAATLRDQIKALTFIQADQNISIQDLKDTDVMALHREGGFICVQVFFFRQGNHYGNHAFFPKAEEEFTTAEIFTNFIMQFYDNKPVPEVLLVSEDVSDQDLIIEALSEKAGKKVSVSTPQRGDKKSLMGHALSNAKQALHHHLSKQAEQDLLLESLVDIFDLDDVPERIEVYDNSHISGEHQIGAMIVAGREGFIKNQYRKFNIKQTEQKGDDFGMMREVFERRFKRALKEDPERSLGLWPDLILVDGGKGQLSSAYGVLEGLGIIDIPIFGISKGPDRNAGREKFHRIDGSVFELPPTHQSLFFIQRMRDESHRFAIGSHRTKRAKNTFKSPLDDIPGIGGKRKKALLLHFGSAKAVSEASMTDLAKVEGISAAFSERIYNYFHVS